MSGIPQGLLITALAALALAALAVSVRSWILLWRDWRRRYRGRHRGRRRGRRLEA